MMIRLSLWNLNRNDSLQNYKSFMKTIDNGITTVASNVALSKRLSNMDRIRTSLKGYELFSKNQVLVNAKLKSEKASSEEDNSDSIGKEIIGGQEGEFPLFEGFE